MPPARKSSSSALSPDGIVALGLALQPPRYHQQPKWLPTLLPFLALGRRETVAQAVSMRRDAVSAMPWPGVRWFSWANASRAATSAASLTRGEASTPPETRCAAGQTEAPAMLAPVLGIVAVRHGQSEGATGPEQALARTSPFLANSLITPTAQAPRQTNRLDDQTRLPEPTTVNVVETDAGAAAHSAARRSLVELVWQQMEIPAPAQKVTTLTGISPTTADARLPATSGVSAAANLPWRGSLVDLAASSTAALATQARISQPSLRVSKENGNAGLLGQLPATLMPEVLATAAGFDESHRGGSTPLTWRRRQLPAEAAGLVALPELATVSEAVEHLVEQHVQRVLDQRLEHLQAQAGGPPPVPGSSLAEETLVDDNVARALMRKLQSLAEEERSRQGYLP